MTEDVLPEGEPTPLRVQATSKLAFGATTAALVTLASSGTAVLVSSGASSLQAPTALPPTTSLTDPGAVRGDVVVDRAPGTYGELVVQPPAQAAVDPTADALARALAQRPEPGRRTLTVPLVDLGVAPPTVSVPVPLVPVVVPEVPVAEVPVGPGPKPPAKADDTKADDTRADDTKARAEEIRRQQRAAEREAKRAQQAQRQSKARERAEREAAKALKREEHGHGKKGRHTR